MRKLGQGRSRPGSPAAALPWTTPADLRVDLERRWERGDIPRAVVQERVQAVAAVPGAAEAEPLFPLKIRLKRPSARELAERFGDVMAWVDGLRAESRERLGFGYELRWRTVNSRLHGANDIPVAAVFPQADDVLRFIRRRTEATRLGELADFIVGQFPGLAPWVIRRPLQVLEHAEQWNRLLAVVGWFAAHPRPRLYLRQLDIPGVDTKFIEAHRGLLAELLDLVLPPEAIDTSARGVAGFAARYGLKEEAPLIRFRLLAPSLHICGLSDLAVLPEEFARLNPGARRVFITENRTNGLAFPAVAGGIVIFGLGYGVDRLGDIPWLHQVEVWYWGDIDTHGFGILNRLRAVLPDVRSFLMDRETLLAHRALWGQEPAHKRYDGEPSRLTPEEYALFDDLRRDRLGPRIRLEQERVGWGWLQERLRDVQNVTGGYGPR